MKYAQEKEQAETVGDFEMEFDAVVVAWHPDKSGRGRGNGFVRVTTNRRSFGLFLKESNVVTLGVETLGISSRVRCEIGKPDPGYTTRQAVNVQIYKQFI